MPRLEPLPGRELPTPSLDHLAPGDAQRVRARLAQLERACGCELGAGAALLASAAYLALVVWAGIPDLGLEWRVAIGIVVFTVASGLGKTAGIARARRERARLVARFAAPDGAPR